MYARVYVCKAALRRFCFVVLRHIIYDIQSTCICIRLWKSQILYYSYCVLIYMTKSALGLIFETCSNNSRTLQMKGKTYYFEESNDLKKNVNKNTYPRGFLRLFCFQQHEQHWMLSETATLYTCVGMPSVRI